MSDTHITPEDVRPGDPTRFGPSRLDLTPEPRSRLEAVGAALAVLAFVVGIPVLLLVLAGVPSLPDDAGSLRSLAQQLTVEDLISVLVGVVWVAWLYFCVCLVVELVAALRGGVARRLPVAGPLQRLARILVGAIVLTGIAAGPAQAATDAATSVAPSSTSSVAMVLDDAVQVGNDTQGVVQAEALAAEATEVAAASEGDKIYTVKAPDNGYHDNLWDIAERHLGDGRRYAEIFELNKDREMSGGGKLELARLIQPGWELVMPDDAVGVPKTGGTVAPEAATLPPAPAPVDDGDTSGSDAEAAAEEGVGAGQLGGAGLLLAGLLGALAYRRRRGAGRRPGDEALEAEAEFVTFAAGSRASGLADVLRHLAESSREARATPPSIYAALVSDDAVELLLAPASTTTVAGWTAHDEGRRWRFERDGDLDVDPRTAVPYPALVSLGVDDDGRDVMLDLEAAGGIVSLTGDGAQTTQVAAALALQAASSPWGEAADVTAVDLHPAMAHLDHERLTVVDDLGAALADWEARIDDLRQDALTGRMSRRGVPSHVVVLGRAPEADVADRLGALTGAGRQTLSVVVADDHPAARWRLEVSEDGTLTADQLGLTVHANRLTSTQVEALAELFEAASDVTPVDRLDRPAVAAPVHRHDEVDWSTAQRRVGVLGSVGVRSGSTLSAHRADLATELVVFLALHPEGVHPNVLAGAVWPRGVDADVRAAAVRRARGWLGTMPDGSYFLREDGEGRLSLASTVVCDWDVLRTLLSDARAASDPRTEADFLRRALSVVRGEPFGELPDGRYGWVATEDLRRRMVALVRDAALRLSELGTDDPTRVEDAVRAGLRVDPGCQELWRRLVRARHQADAAAGLQQVMGEMGEALRGVDLEPETEALFDELGPDDEALSQTS